MRRYKNQLFPVYMYVGDITIAGILKPVAEN